VTSIDSMIEEMEAFVLEHIQQEINKPCLTLALETSCDETSASVVADGRIILSNIISSQVPVHQKYGGVVPEIASRKHIENVLPVVDQALFDARVTLSDISAIGVTYGPGLVGALLVGVSVAKALSFATNIPLVGVNHLEGHIFANFLAHRELEPPFMALVVSGGHTSLVHVKGYNEFALLGQTRDDAAGEAFDKVARVMKLPYPGGPYIDSLALAGNPEAIAFPRALPGKNSFEFSFSGLKSAVLNYLNSAAQKQEEINPADVAASFQAAVVDVLVSKSLQAAAACGVKQVVVAGGVAANSGLKAKMAYECEKAGFSLHYPDPILCTDNAAMIACRAYYQHIVGDYTDLHLNAKPSLKLGHS
jgi:N6-L-threonylcarbamoyladenine synthase